MSKQSAALSSATQYATPPELGGKWGTRCLNTRFPLPTLLCAGYSVKLKKKKFTKIIVNFSITHLPISTNYRIFTPNLKKYYKYLFKSNKQQQLTFKDVGHLAYLQEGGALGPREHHVHERALELADVLVLVEVHLGVDRHLRDTTRVLLEYDRYFSNSFTFY